jgi:hypothetical protein
MLGRMSEPITRVTLFVPGTPASANDWNRALRGLRIESGVLRGAEIEAQAEWIENDGSFGAAFSFGTAESKAIEAISAAPGALVLHWTVDLREGRAQIVRAIEGLRDAGALAVRLEQSKLGWDVATWLRLFGSNDSWSWHRGAIVFLGGDGTLQTCGMHAFSLPDACVRLDSGEASALRELASVLNVYQLNEDPVLQSGHTFAADGETPRRLLERWPDTGYPPGHPCHNPYGVWRLGAPGGTARPRPFRKLTLIPALHPILLSLDSKNGKPLTQAQVEAARDGAACMMMEPRDAQKLERSRGYADLDPELAWEQWQLVRTGY